MNNENVIKDFLSKSSELREKKSALLTNIKNNVEKALLLRNLFLSLALLMIFFTSLSKIVSFEDTLTYLSLESETASYHTAKENTKSDSSTLLELSKMLQKIGDEQQEKINSMLSKPNTENEKEVASKISSIYQSAFIASFGLIVGSLVLVSYPLFKVTTHEMMYRDVVALKSSTLANRYQVVMIDTKRGNDFFSGIVGYNVLALMFIFVWSLGLNSENFAGYNHIQSQIVFLIYISIQMILTMYFLFALIKFEIKSSKSKLNKNDASIKSIKKQFGECVMLSVDELELVQSVLSSKENIIQLNSMLEDCNEDDRKTIRLLMNDIREKTKFIETTTEEKDENLMFINYM